jgi:hypothetical protein
LKELWSDRLIEILIANPSKLHFGQEVLYGDLVQKYPLSCKLGCHNPPPLKDRRPRRSTPSQERPLLATCVCPILAYAYRTSSQKHTYHTESYLDASCTKPWLSVTLGESVRGCFRYRTFLLNLLKVDSMNHVLSDLVL